MAMTKINLGQIRNLIVEIIIEQEGSENIPQVYDKLNIEYENDFFMMVTDWRSHLIKLLSARKEEELISLAQSVMKLYPTASAIKLIKSLVNDYSISMVTRRKLLDELLLKNNLTGQIDFVDFLKRIWPLESMPSTDYRFETAAGDIWQHMVNNYDWDDHYLFYTYLSLDTADDETFLNFCEQLVHPVVRNDEEDQNEFLELINRHLIKDGYRLENNEQISGYKLYRALSQRKVRNNQKPIKNLIFASNGPKPEIIIVDALQNDIEIVKNAEYCLIYDLPIGSEGLSTQALIDWWNDLHKGKPPCKLSERLKQALPNNSPGEQIIFDAYYSIAKPQILPALLPQVYLYYDPYTMKQLQGKKRLERQRMDFLLIFSDKERVVIEVDGKHHYAEGDVANPQKYAAMVTADRELILSGYEVYHFGGYEFLNVNSSKEIIVKFFEQLLRKYSIKFEDF